MEVSLENRRLLNPAFAGLLLTRSAQGFHRETQNWFPYIYSYLVLPLVLHPETRERLPQAIVTRLPSWAERNSDLTALLPKRMADFAPATREAILLITTAGVANLGERCQIIATTPEKSLTKFEKDSPSEEVRTCLRKAYFLGRWLATSGTAITVMTVLGVRI